MHSLETGALIREFPLDIGEIVSMSGDMKQSEFFYQVESFLMPGTIYRYDFSQPDSEPSVYREVQLNLDGFDRNNFDVEQGFDTEHSDIRISNRFNLTTFLLFSFLCGCWGWRIKYSTQVTMVQRFQCSLYKGKRKKGDQNRACCMRTVASIIPFSRNSPKIGYSSSIRSTAFWLLQTYGAAVNTVTNGEMKLFWINFYILKWFVGICS